MCIRDRIKTAKKLNHQNIVRIYDEGKDGERSFVTMQFLDCLLYTSDAADERSSVDLGGRRIIKKKNITIAGGMSAMASQI